MEAEKFYKPLQEKVRLINESLNILTDSDMREIVSRYGGKTRASSVGENYVIPLDWNVDLVFNPRREMVSLEGRHVSFIFDKYKRDEEYINELFGISNSTMHGILKDANSLRSDRWRRLRGKRPEKRLTLQTIPKEES